MNTNREHLERLFAETDGAPMDAVDQAQCRKLARLLAGWRNLDAAVDWSATARMISTAVRDDAESLASAHVDHLIDPSTPAISETELPRQLVADYRAIDDMLQNTANPLPPVDWDALSSKISASVRREAQLQLSARRAAARKIADPDVNRRSGGWIFRIGVPLAAAAAIALAVWASRGTSPASTNGKPSRVLFATGEDDGKVSVTVDESKPANALMEDTASEGSGIAVGPPRSETNELPIDPSMIP